MVTKLQRKMGIYSSIHISYFFFFFSTHFYHNTFQFGSHEHAENRVIPASCCGNLLNHFSPGALALCFFLFFQCSCLLIVFPGVSHLHFPTSLYHWSLPYSATRTIIKMVWEMSYIYKIRSYIQTHACLCVNTQTILGKTFIQNKRLLFSSKSIWKLYPFL